MAGQRPSNDWIDEQARGFRGDGGMMLRNPVMLKYGRDPYQALLDEVTADVRLQTALSACWFDYMLPPEKASVMFGVGTWKHFLGGAYYPRGGSGGLRNAFVEALEECGAELRESSRVIAIDKASGEFTVRTEDGEQHTSRTVISDVDILVDVAPSIGLDFVTLADDLERLLDRKVDLVSTRAVRPALWAEIEAELIDA